MICIYGSKFERSLFQNQWFDVVGVVSVERILEDSTIALELSWYSN